MRDQEPAWFNSIQAKQVDLESSSMSRGFSGGKQMIKAANARNRGQVCLL